MKERLEGGSSILNNPLTPGQGGAPFVTIITATYNAEKYLEETIISVLGQTYGNIEYIIIDGGSNDSTLDILEKYSSKISYWLSEPDQGIYDAWNKAISLARGEWICYVGADDILLPDAIQNYANFINSNEGEPFEFICSVVELVNDQLKFIRKKGKPWDWNSFRVFMTVAHVGSLHHISLYEKYGKYDTNYKIAADYEFLLRPKSNLKAAFLHKVTAKMRLSGYSNSTIAVFKETLNAKILTASRLKISCLIEYYIAVGKYLLKKAL